MRIGGVEVNEPCEEVLVLPRPTGQDIVIRARAVTSMDQFELICPVPEPPKRVTAKGVESNPDSKAYLQSYRTYSEKRFNYICIKSLEPSDIEWEIVDLEKPSTYGKWQDELQGAGLSSMEINRITDCIMTANALNEAKLKAARESFLRGQEVEQAKSSGQGTEPESTPSGQPASDSESDPQE